MLDSMIYGVKNLIESNTAKYTGAGLILTTTIGGVIGLPLEGLEQIAAETSNFDFENDYLDALGIYTTGGTAAGFGYGLMKDFKLIK